VANYNKTDRVLSIHYIAERKCCACASNCKLTGIWVGR